MEEHNPLPENIEPQKVEQGRQFARSQTDRIFLGICGGIANYLDVDPLIIRFIFVFSILIGGWGAVIYIVAAMLIPVERRTVNLSDEETARLKLANAKTLTGTALILIGIFFIFDYYGIINYFSILGIPPKLFLPVSLIAFGIYFFRREFKLFRFSNSLNKFYRTKTSSRFLGVCSGLANYLNTDSNLIRMIWIVFTFMSLGLGVVVYFLIVAMVPYYNED